MGGAAAGCTTVGERPGRPWPGSASAPSPCGCRRRCWWRRRDRRRRSASASACRCSSRRQSSRSPCCSWRSGCSPSQVAPMCHDANLLGAGVIVVSYLLRMAADSDPSLGWLRWASPLGWVEELHAAHWLAAAAVPADRGAYRRPRCRVRSHRCRAGTWVPARWPVGTRAAADAAARRAGRADGAAYPRTIATWVGALTATGVAFGLARTSPASPSRDHRRSTVSSAGSAPPAPPPSPTSATCS